MSELKKNAESKNGAQSGDQSLDELIDAAQSKVTRDRHAGSTKGKSTKRSHLPVWVPVLAWIVFVVSFVMHYDQMVNPFPKPDLRQIEHSTRLEMITAADLVDQWRSEHGELPGTLPESITARDFISYKKDGDKYILSVTLEGKALDFKEGEDKAAFLKAALTD